MLLLCLAAAPSAWASTGAASDGTAPENLAVEPVELLSGEQLAELVAPVALYPDDLLAIVLPASTFPLQVVLAARFLEAREADPNLEPDSEWDPAVVALLNYPEVVALLDRDIKWTWQLGEAVLVQQEDVIAAVAEFREQASAAGNLESDEKQVVSVNAAGAIEITPVERETIYVPYYDPQAVRAHQPTRAYHYFPRAYPVYYYPYPSGHYFSNGAFWGVTSAFSIGWHSRSLHWHHYGFRDHPYFGFTYHDPFYYRRPHIWLNVYSQDRSRRHDRRHREDNRWRNDDRRVGPRPGYRPNWRDRYGQVDEPVVQDPGNRRGIEPPGGPAARGIQRTVVARPDKRSGHIPVGIGAASTKSPANSSKPIGTPSLDNARLPATRNPQAAPGVRKPQRSIMQRAPAAATRATRTRTAEQRPVGAQRLPAASTRARNAEQRPVRVQRLPAASTGITRPAKQRPAAIQRLPAAARAPRSVEQRPANVQRPRPARRDATPSAHRLPEQRSLDIRAAAKPPTRILRQPVAQPAPRRSASSVAKPVRKPANVQRPAAQPRQPLRIRAPRSTDRPRRAEPPKEVPPRLQQRQKPEALTRR